MPGHFLEDLLTGRTLAQLWPAGNAHQVLRLACVNGGSAKLKADRTLQLNFLLCDLLLQVLQFKLQLHHVITKGSLQLTHLLTYPL